METIDLLCECEDELDIGPDKENEESLKSVEYDAALDQTCFDFKSFLYTTIKPRSQFYI